MMYLYKFLVLCLTISFLSACNAAVPVEKRRFFFPPEPAPPKIEYIKSYFSDHDLKSETRSFLTKYVLGESPPSALFEKPVDIVSNGGSKVYVADSGKRNVFILDLQNNSYRMLFSSSMSNSELFVGVPVGLALDDKGRLYVVDVLKKSVDIFSAEGAYLNRISNPDLARPTAVAVDSQNGFVFVLDTANHQVVKFTMTGEMVEAYGQRGNGPVEFNYPTDIDTDEDGNIFVLDTLNARVQVLDSNGKFVKQFGERGTAQGSFSVPKGLAVSSEGHVYVSDSLGHKVVVFNRDGDFLLRIGGKSVAQKGVSPGGFYLPRGVAYDDSDRLWVVDSLNRMVHRFQYLTPGYLSKNPIN